MTFKEERDKWLVEYAEKTDYELDVLADTACDHIQKSAVHHLRRQRKHAELKRRDVLEEERHNKTIELTKIGNKHAHDAVFWAIVASILAGIGILISVLAWMSSSH